MTVAQATELRVKMREAGASYKVAKNRLARLALDGTSYTSLDGLLVGPTGLATSVDPVAAAKVAVEFAKKNDKFEIVGGAMGDTVLDVNGVKALAELPSLRSEEHTSELQSLMRISSAVFCLKKKT